jgi:hypothetical protein
MRVYGSTPFAGGTAAPLKKPFWLSGTALIRTDADEAAP